MDETSREMTSIDIDEQEMGTANIQFQVLTAFVWIGVFFLLVLDVREAREGAIKSYKLMTPLIHLAPWCVGVVERRRIQRSTPALREGQSQVQKALTRILWSGYLALTLVEYWLYWLA